MSDYSIITPTNWQQETWIHDVVVKPLKVNRDPRGILVETLKTTWEDVYNQETAPFTQMYYSTTEPGVARDIDRWHFHPGGQQDRFGVIRGDIVVGILDNREDSPTKGKLNLFQMGESNGDEGQYMLMIPKRVLHGFVVVGSAYATLFNYPTRLYDPHEEVRVLFSDALLSNGEEFSWEKVKQEYEQR